MDISNKVYKFYNQKPKYTIEVIQGNIHYNLDIYRKLTIIEGNSGTGKTTFLEFLAEYNKNIYGNIHNLNGIYSEVVVNTNAKYVVNQSIIRGIELLDVDVFLYDDSHMAVQDINLLQFLMENGKYVVIVYRESYIRMNYAVSEIYKISQERDNIKNTHVNKYKYNNKISRLYEDIIINTSTIIDNNSKIKTILVEDSGTGFEIFKLIFSRYGVHVISTYGKNNITPKIMEMISEGSFSGVLIVADSANYGKEIKDLLYLIDTRECYFLMYESFEFIVLESLLAFDKLSEVLNTDLMQIADKLNYNFEKIFESILKKASLRTNADGNIISNNKTIIDDLVDSVRIGILGKGISYSKSEVNKTLFSEDRLKEIENGIYQCIVRNPKAVNQLNWR